MHQRFSSETPSEDGDNQLPYSSGGFLDMLYGDNEGNSPTQRQFKAM